MPTATLIHGENAVALARLAPTHAGRVTLAYLDPPFFTGKMQVFDDRRGGGAAFDDRWDDLPAYLAWLRERLALVRPLLADHGSIVVHVDPKTSHYVRVLGDELFSFRAFASEIVWRYRRWPARTQNFQRVHDVLLRWVANPDVEPRFFQLYEPLAPSTKKTWGDRKQRAIVDDAGKRLRSSTGAERSPGTPLGDVWEIGILAPMSRERTGYPTQKPRALLDRLVRSLSAPGDLVLDATAGSGTTLCAAIAAGRDAIGIDVNAEALAIGAKRLLELGATVTRARSA